MLAMAKTNTPTTLDAWLSEVEGRAAAMARHFNVSDAAVNDWRKNGVPVRRMKAVRDYTGNCVTLESMVPDAEPAKQAAKAEA